MDDSTPGSVEDQNLGVQDTSLDNSQQSADTSSDTTSSTDASQGATDDTPHVNQDSTDDVSHETQAVDEVAEWAKKQGYDLDNPTPEQVKTLAKRVIDNQKAFHESQQRAKAAGEVSQGVGETFDDINEDPARIEVQKELAAIRTERFFTKNPDAEEYAGKMVELIQQERDSFGDDAARILANNLPRLLTLARAESANADSTARYEQGRQDERQNLAKSQQAGAPAASAVNSAPQSSVVTDKAIGEMTTAQYLEWRKSHNPWDVATA